MLAEEKIDEIEEIMKKFSVDVFEYIKIDVEGAEYEILENLPYNCSKQISVEFHAFLDLTPSMDVEKYHSDLLDKMNNYFVSHEQLEPLRGSAGVWQRDDTLYVLKDFL